MLKFWGFYAEYGMYIGINSKPFPGPIPVGNPVLTLMTREINGGWSNISLLAII